MTGRESSRARGNVPGDAMIDVSCLHCGRVVVRAPHIDQPQASLMTQHLRQSHAEGLHGDVAPPFGDVLVQFAIRDVRPTESHAASRTGLTLLTPTARPRVRRER